LRVLSSTGAMASVVVGTIAVAAGWSWGILLIVHFVAASALSKIGEDRKSKSVAAIVEKFGERDATQVMANGAVYAAAALGHIANNSPIWYALGIGALAASAADTWATEIGTLSTRRPVSIVTGLPIPAGTSGGISFLGLLASFFGALFIAAGGALARWPVPFTAIALGGLAGGLSDSLLGATLQTRRWCDVCAKATERVVHDCGNPTRRTGGIHHLGNDAVNAICSAVGALITLLLS